MAIPFGWLTFVVRTKGFWTCLDLMENNLPNYHFDSTWSLAFLGSQVEIVLLDFHGLSSQVNGIWNGSKKAKEVHKKQLA